MNTRTDVSLETGCGTPAAPPGRENRMPATIEPESSISTPSIESPPVRLPRKILRERPCNSAVRDAYINADVPRPLAEFLGRRLDRFIEWESLVRPKLSQVADPGAILTMDRAVERIVRAIRTGERIALACDHDMDGTASAAVLWTALIEFFSVPAERLSVFTSHRLNEGYGIGDGVVSRIQEFGAQLVISADKGSGDEPRIAALASAGVDVVVTDHHVIPAEGPPKSAYAVVNPSRADGEYDPHVCGAGVAFLVMAKVRSALLEQGILAAIPPLTSLLDYVAAATIADCVSLSPGASLTNRAFIRRGLEMVRAGTRPCWRVFAREQHGEIDADTLAFRLVPAVAAAGRLDWAEVGFRFLIAKTEGEAMTCWAELKRENTERQAIERRLREIAFPEAAKVDDPAIVLFFPDGHAGVHGITASRVVETFGKPCAIFAPRGQGARSISVDRTEDLASGSFRSVPGVDVRSALQSVAESHPGLLLAFGGHVAAAGATIRIADIARFREAFVDAVRRQAPDGSLLSPILWTDGELEDEAHTLACVQAFDAIGPFGRGFEAPIHSGTFRVVSCQALTCGKHARLCLQRGDLVLPAIWFGIDTCLEELPTTGDRLQIAYRLSRRVFQDRVNLQAVIVGGGLDGRHI